MTSKFDARITVDAGDCTGAIFDSINTDNKYYPENPTKTKMSLDNKIVILSTSDHLSHFRANLNSILRLIQVSYDSLESARVR